MSVERWSTQALEDLRLWLISERLPPEVGFSEIVEIVELAVKADGRDEVDEELADVKKELEEEVERREAAEQEIEKLKDELAELKDELAALQQAS